jgi:hypothetical protein
MGAPFKSSNIYGAPFFGCHCGNPDFDTELPNPAVVEKLGSSGIARKKRGCPTPP